MSLETLVDTFRNLVGLGEPQGDRGQFGYAQREVEKIRKTFAETIQNWFDRTRTQSGFRQDFLRTMLYIPDEEMTKIASLQPYSRAQMESCYMKDTDYPRFAPVTVDPADNLQSSFDAQSKEIAQQLETQGEGSPGLAGKITALRNTGRALGMMLAVQDANASYGKSGRTIDFARYQDEVVGFAIRDHIDAVREIKYDSAEHPDWQASTLTDHANMHFSRLFEHNMQHSKEGALWGPQVVGYEHGGIFVKNDGTIRSQDDLDSYKRKALRQNPYASGSLVRPRPVIVSGSYNRDWGYD